jgi:glutathione synthase/RimK-type ligase-like ATP-grasp enzyme
LPSVTCVDVLFTKIWNTGSISWPNEDTKDTEETILLTVDGKHLTHASFGPIEAEAFFTKCLATASSNKANVSLARLIIPISSGYVARSDILSQRFLDCPGVLDIASFTRPQQRLEGNDLGRGTLFESFARSMGALRLDTTDSGSGPSSGTSPILAFNPIFESLDKEMQDRLTFPWLGKTTAKQQRPTLAIVDGGLSSPDTGGTGGSIYLAAQALGIDMVVFDSPNHWVNSQKYRHWRKDTVELELLLKPDAGFSDRIFDAVRSYEGHLDGIVTFRDHYKFFVAQAAERLGLPTSPSASYAIATDKYETRISEGHAAYKASTSQQAAELINKHSVGFPVIIKPTNGFLSEGVHRVESLSDLETHVQLINTDRHGMEFVIERYCDGPELDINVVMINDEIILFEASDDFPKGADSNAVQGTVGTFIEVANVLPTALPQNEQNILREDLRQSLIRMGFHDGFFHIEARIEGSSMAYSTEQGVLDLRPRERLNGLVGPPNTWLIEVNPRPPGIQASEAIRHTYGVDYFGIALLFALDDKERIMQLSHTFARGPQYWCEMVFIPVEAGGSFESSDVCQDLFQRRPDLAKNITSHFCFLRKGDKVQDPLTSGVNSWVAYFNVYSRQSRAHLLELAQSVRREVRYTII